MNRIILFLILSLASFSAFAMHDLSQKETDTICASLATSGQNQTEAYETLCKHFEPSMGQISSAASNAVSKVGDATANTITDAKPVLVEALKSFVAELKEGAEWAKVQIPEVVHQLVMWRIAQDIALIVVFPIFVLIFFSLGFPIRNRSKTLKSYDTDLSEFFGTTFIIIGAIATIASVAALFIAGLDLLELIFAPKIWLLEYTANLIATVKGH